MIDGSTVYNVSKEAKEDLLESEIFQELLELRISLRSHGQTEATQKMK
jgi:hypothetical protein